MFSKFFKICIFFVLTNFMSAIALDTKLEHRTIAGEVCSFFKKNLDNKDYITLCMCDTKQVMPKFYEMIHRLEKNLNCKNGPYRVALSMLGSRLDFNVKDDNRLETIHVSLEVLSKLTDAELESLLTYSYFRDNEFMVSIFKKIDTHKAIIMLLLLYVLAYFAPFILELLTVALIDALHFGYLTINEQLQVDELGDQIRDLGLQWRPFVLLLLTTIIMVFPLCVWFGILTFEPYFVKKWDLQAANVISDPAVLVEAHDKFDKLCNWGFWKNLFLNSRKISKEQRAKYIAEWNEQRIENIKKWLKPVASVGV